MKEVIKKFRKYLSVSRYRILSGSTVVGPMWVWLTWVWLSKPQGTVFLFIKFVLDYTSVKSYKIVYSSS